MELVLQESKEVVRTRPGTIVVEHRLGFICANAGIDHSNVAGAGDSKEEWVLLLPEHPDRSAEDLRREIESRTGKRIGVLIIDSHGRAWRNGTVGVAIGLSGLPGLEDLRRRKICSTSPFASPRSARRTSWPPPHLWSWDRPLRELPSFMCAAFLIR